MAKLTVETSPFQNPAWSSATLNPGTEATLKVDAPKIKAGQNIEFRIFNGAELIEVVSGADAQQSAKWKVPNLPDRPKLKFDAVLKEKPGPKNGFNAVLRKLTSAETEVKGFKVAITSIDPAFVPHTEKLEVVYEVDDPAGAAAKGRIEIWGERYSTDKPLYTENFDPSNGVGKDWKTWEGNATAGKSSGKFISPEYSPYRLRIIIGVDQAAVDDPYGVGLTKVAIAESPFEVAFQSINIRIQAGIVEAAAAAPANAPYLLSQVLGIDRQPDGTFTATGRLPTSNPAELCRIRIPMACHHRKTESLSQVGLLLGGAYFGAGAASKNSIDATFYWRPEIPIEFELRLRSRVDGNNTGPTRGLFDKESVGPAKIEPFAEDVFMPAIVNGGGLNQSYWRKAAFKVKKGTVAVPVRNGAAPVFSNWQARFEVAGNGDQTFDLDNFDPADKTYRYKKANSELTVWLNRAKLVLAANEAAMNKGQGDYIEVDIHTIKLRPNFTRAADILWIVRSDPADAAARWTSYPPGTNCHAIYGGMRSAARTDGVTGNNLFLKDYSANPGPPRELTIGKTTAAYPYAANDHINLTPDPAAGDRERVEITAMLTGAQQGLAGVLFSPSFIAGDSYAIHARLDSLAYERNLGWVESKSRLEEKTGTLQVWRVMTISSSIRLPDTGTAGLSAGIGCAPDPALPRTYIADGINMDVTAMNGILADSFNEWIASPPGPGAPVADVHKDVNLGTYVATYSGLPIGAGQIAMAGAANVTNEFVPFDHYRVNLPRNLRYPNAAAIIISGSVIAGVAAQPAGTPSATVMAAVQARDTAIGAAGPDDALPADVAAIPVSGLAPKAYVNWILSINRTHRQTIIDALTPRMAQPKTMQVIRWPKLHDYPLWDDGGAWTTNGGIIQGFELGDGQSFFITDNLDPILFPHEMGHGSHLAHFVSGSMFYWKHHHLLQPDCMMSYNFGHGFIVKPGTLGGVVGGGATADNGWPSVVPAVLPGDSSVAPGTAAGTKCVRLDHPAAPGNPCAKCMLTLRGWEETLLPVAWGHPDLF